MRSVRRQRTISYLKARWGGAPQNATLQGVVDASLAVMPSVRDTLLECLDGHAAVFDRHIEEQEPTLLHIAQWSDGAEMSTVPNPEDVAEQRLQTLGPDDTYDFLNGDGMLLIAGDHALVIASNELRPPALRRYLRDLIRHCEELDGGPPSQSTGYELTYMEDPNVAARIGREGIKSVRLHLARYLGPAVDDVPTSAPVTSFQLLAAAVAEVPASRDRAHILGAPNVFVDVTLGIRANRLGLEPSALRQVAEDALRDAEYEDDVELITGRGNSYRKGQLALSKKVNLPAYGKTVLHTAAWAAMLEYFVELGGDGALQ